MLLRKIVHTSDDRMLTFVRVVLGTVFLAHGAQKVLGWFGGPGFDATMKSFTQNMGIPAFFAVLAILAEFRIAAFGIAVNMAVAILLVHAPNGFFMNWAGNQRGEGFEYHLLVI